MIKACNRILTKKTRNDKGKRKAPHFKICYGCENYEDDLDEDDPNFYWLQFEVDEKLLNTLADVNVKGRLKLGATNIMLLGGGMVAKAKERIADQLKESINNRIKLNNCKKCAKQKSFVCTCVARAGQLSPNSFE